MDGVALRNRLHMDLAVVVAVLPGRLLQKIERELVKRKVRSRADKKAATRRMRRIIGSRLLGQAQRSAVEALPPPLPYPSSIPRTPTIATAPVLERKVDRLEAELQMRDRSRQKRNDAFRSLKISEHTKMLQLMDANDYIDRLEAELEETKNKTVSWVHRAESYKAERYKAFAPLIDQISFPARAIEWGILARQLEFWCGIVALIILLAAIYAVGKYLGNAAPAAYQIPISCPRQIPCPRLPRAENNWGQPFPIAECPPVECPKVPDCPAGSDLHAAGKCSGHRHLLASFAIGVVTGGVSTWQTVQAMD